MIWELITCYGYIVNNVLLSGVQQRENAHFVPKVGEQWKWSSWVPLKSDWRQNDSVAAAVSINRNVGTNIKMLLLNSFNSSNVVLNLNRDLYRRKFAWDPLKKDTLPLLSPAYYYYFNLAGMAWMENTELEFSWKIGPALLSRCFGKMRAQGRAQGRNCLWKCY